MSRMFKKCLLTNSDYLKFPRCEDCGWGDEVWGRGRECVVLSHSQVVPNLKSKHVKINPFISLNVFLLSASVGKHENSEA